MLKVKYLTFFKQKNEKRQEILRKLKRKSSVARFFFNLVSRFSLFLTKIWFSIECR